MGRNLPRVNQTIMTTNKQTTTKHSPKSRRNDIETCDIKMDLNEELKNVHSAKIKVFETKTSMSDV